MNNQFALATGKRSPKSCGNNLRWGGVSPQPAQAPLNSEQRFQELGPVNGGEIDPGTIVSRECFRSIRYWLSALFRMDSFFAHVNRFTAAIVGIDGRTNLYAEIYSQCNLRGKPAANIFVSGETPCVDRRRFESFRRFVQEFFVVELGSGSRCADKHRRSCRTGYRHWVPQTGTRSGIFRFSPLWFRWDRVPSTGISLTNGIAVTLPSSSR